MDTMSRITGSSSSLESTGLAFQVGIRDTARNMESQSTQPAVSSADYTKPVSAGEANAQPHHSSSGIDMVA